MGQKKVVEKRFVAARMDQMRRKKLGWLWPQRIALGTLTVLAGDFESGKSLLAADLAARVSRGESWPDGRASSGPSQVLVLNHEDCTLLEMLESAGADMSRIVPLEEIEEFKNRKSEFGSEEEDGGEKLETVKRRPINLKIDLEALDEQLAGMENCRLVIVDPIDAHLTGGNTVAARMWLRSMGMIAAKHQVAMVLVTGLKEGRKSPLYRLMGGMGLAGAARAVWAVAPEVRDQRSEVRSQESGEKRLLLMVKNNLSGERLGLAFRLVMDEGRDVPRVEWSSDVVTENVDELMERLQQKKAKPSFAVRQAMDFLSEALANGPRLIQEVIVEAKEREGISRTSLERARKEMEVKAFRKQEAWWVCLKKDKAGKTAVSGRVEGAEGLKGVEGLGNVAGGRTTENTKSTENRGHDQRQHVESVEGLEVDEDVEGLDGVGNETGGNAELPCSK